MKITTEEGLEIYRMATDPNRKMTNSQIGAIYKISESAVRHCVKKHEKELRQIAKNDEKLNNALTNQALNVHAEVLNLLDVIKAGIEQAKKNNVSPEKISPLYNSLLKSLEMAQSLMERLRPVEPQESEDMKAARAIMESPDLEVHRLAYELLVRLENGEKDKPLELEFVKSQ